MNLLMLFMLTLACTSEVIITGSMALGEPQDVEQGQGGEGLQDVDDVVDSLAMALVIWFSS